jgi:hypothetical protein
VFHGQARSRRPAARRPQDRPRLTAGKGIVTVEGVVADAPGPSMRTAGPGQTEHEARGVASNGGSSATAGFRKDGHDGEQHELPVD